MREGDKQQEEKKQEEDGNYNEVDRSDNEKGGGEDDDDNDDVRRHSKSSSKGSSRRKRSRSRSSSRRRRSRSKEKRRRSYDENSRSHRHHKSRRHHHHHHRHHRSYSRSPSPSSHSYEKSSNGEESSKSSSSNRHQQHVYKRRKKSLFDLTAEQMMEFASSATPEISPSMNPSAPGVITGFARKDITIPVTALVNPLLVQQQQRIPPQQQTPQQRQARRIYVGNIPRDTNEQEMIIYFNDAMKKLGVLKTPGDPIVGAQINYEKNFIFLDFRYPEEATQAMALDGIRMRENILKVRRPNNYVPPSGHDEKPSVAPLPGLVSTNVPNSENKLFIGGLPSQMSEEQVLQLLNGIGQLNAFNLVKDVNTGLSKGYGFCEFSTTEATDKAIATLNGFEMGGGKKILVQRASIGAKHGSSAAVNQTTSIPSHTSSPSQLDPLHQAVSSMLNLSLRIEVALTHLSQAENVFHDATNILVLLNCVTLSDLMDEDEYHDLVDDIRNECSKYGNIKSIIIPRPDSLIREHYKHDPENDEVLTHDEYSGIPGIGKIFVEYEDVQNAQYAQYYLAGKKFQGRTVITSYHSVQDFYNGIL